MDPKSSRKPPCGPCFMSDSLIDQYFGVVRPHLTLLPSYPQKLAQMIEDLLKR